MSLVQPRRDWGPLLLIAVMVTAFYYPVLFQNKAQIHAESVSLGVALMHILSSALHTDNSVLWTTGIYGGHPIFAEGQGGFANPLHLLMAWLLPAVPAFNLHQALSTLVGGFGAYGMCRSINCSRMAATFAALALVFSTLWIIGWSNLAVASTVSFIPWVFWAMHYWYRNANFGAACFFATTMALMVVSGYPQLVHGVLIYLTVYLLFQLLWGAERRLILARFVPLASTLLLAVLLCVGLSAVQWIPLLELAGESHRSDGIAMGGLDGAPPVTFLRGFLYTLPDPHELPNAAAGVVPRYFPASGSLLVCLIFTSVFLFRRNVLINGHIAAAVILLMLGLGSEGTPLFALLYDNNLVPGLRNFRVTYVYLYVALVGCSLLAAVALDRLAEQGSGDPGQSRSEPKASGYSPLVTLLWGAFWLAAVAWLHLDGVSSGQYFIVAIWLLCCVSCLLARKCAVLPGAAVVLLLIEILSYRIGAFHFGDADLIAKPDSIENLESKGNLPEFKFADRNWANTYSLYPPKSPHVAPGLARLLESVTPAANVLWGVSSLTGNTALDIRRRAMADPLINEELGAGNKRVPGVRLIDFVSLKYLSVGEQFHQPGFEEAYVNSKLRVRIVDNTHAHPRFQFFDTAVFVSGAAEAVATLAQLNSRVLVLESGSSLPVATVDLPVAEPTEEGEPDFSLVHDATGRYEFEIEAAEAVWFFLADVNYPGWKAYINGQRTSLYSAQLLGKAVLVPAGQHKLVVAFESTSFRIGLVITTVSLCLLSIVLVPGWRRRTAFGKEPASQAAVRQ